MMDRLTVYQTNKGRYSVRPIDWEGIWDKKRRIQENGLNHTGIFAEKEDAEFFAKTKNAEEQGKLLILPCKPGDTVHYIYMDCSPDYEEVYCIDHQGGCPKCHHRVPTIMSKKYTLNDIGMPVYLTEQEAKEALEGMKDVN